MADQDSLTGKRTSAKAKFTRTISSLQHDNNNMDEVTKAFDDFHTTCIRLEQRHDNYMEALE